jgi:hypothetical protein
LKRALTACCKNTDFSDTVAVFDESLPEVWTTTLKPRGGL